VTVDGPERQRAVGHQPHELVDQPRGDRRGQGAAEHLQGGVRPAAPARTIEIVSKSGSQNYHGSGYWYGRRDAWNAIPWRTSGGDRQAEAEDRHAGIQLGGPVKIPGLDTGGDKKLFFFYSMEARRCRKPAQVRL